MRGQQKNIKSLTISGNVYLLHYQDEEIKAAGVGDIYLYLHNEEELYPVVMSEYSIKGFKGYFKAKIFDGKIWCLLDSLDFFEDRIHQFGKSDIPIYNFYNCQERLQEQANNKVYRTYREHYSTYLHESSEFKGKKGNYSSRI